VTAAVFFIWMIRGNGGSSGRSIQTPEATNHASQQQAQQSGTGGQSGSTSVMPDKQPLPLAPPPMTPAALRSGETAFPVRFLSSPAGAQVVVDEDQNLNCATPCELPLRSGRHTFTVSSPDYEGAQGIMQVPDVKERFVLLAKDLETVHIYSNPAKMSISVDGESKGQTPLTLRLHAGEHKITSSGDASYQGTIEVARRGMNIFTINGKSAVPARGGAQGDEAAPQATPH
jgi:hypothetical protein